MASSRGIPANAPSIRAAAITRQRLRNTTRANSDSSAASTPLARRSQGRRGSDDVHTLRIKAAVCNSFLYAAVVVLQIISSAHGLAIKTRTGAGSARSRVGMSTRLKLLLAVEVMRRRSGLHVQALLRQYCCHPLSPSLSCVAPRRAAGGATHSAEELVKCYVILYADVELLYDLWSADFAGMERDDGSGRQRQCLLRGARG